MLLGERQQRVYGFVGVLLVLMSFLLEIPLFPPFVVPGFIPGFDRCRIVLAAVTMAVALYFPFPGALVAVDGRYKHGLLTAGLVF